MLVASTVLVSMIVTAIVRMLVTVMMMVPVLVRMLVAAIVRVIVMMMVGVAAIVRVLVLMMVVAIVRRLVLVVMVIGGSIDGHPQRHGADADQDQQRGAAEHHEDVHPLDQQQRQQVLIPEHHRHDAERPDDADGAELLEVVCLGVVPVAVVVAVSHRSRPPLSGQRARGPIARPRNFPTQSA